MPVFQGLDNTGVAIPNGRLCTYVAGTTTPATTYTSSSLSVANGVPPTGLQLDSAGRANVFLQSGQSYKFVLRSASSTDCSTGTVIWSQDGVAATPASASNLDLLGTVGESITAGQAVYLSDGSGGKTAGQWYRADNANAYSSTYGPVGIAPGAITSLTAGTIRIGGEASGLSSLTIGATYYVGTLGAVTSTAPTNNIRVLGTADTTSTITLTANPYVPATQIGDCNGRMTLTTATPVTTADVTAAVALFFTPYKGNRCALYDGTRWTMRTFSEVSIGVPGTTSTMYDAFLYDNAGTLTLEYTAWSNDTARATALVMQDGVLVRSGATTRRYLGSFRTTTVSGQSEDSLAKRYVWNYYNRVPRICRVAEATNTWTYSTQTWRQANGAATNQLDVVVGVAEVSMDVRIQAMASVNGTTVAFEVAVGVDSTTTPVSGVTMGFALPAVANAQTSVTAFLIQYPSAGRHTYVWLEEGNGTATTTWFGPNSNASQYQSAIMGVIQG